MPLREFRDAARCEWVVWEVQPVWIERRRVQDSEVLAAVGERRRRDSGEVRVRIDSELARGWLAFESKAERRRLFPFPRNWESLPEAQLAELLDHAIPTQRSKRLIE